MRTAKTLDQTGRMPRLTWVFAGRTRFLLVLSCHGSFRPSFLVHEQNCDCNWWSTKRRCKITYSCINTSVPEMVWIFSYVSEFNFNFSKSGYVLKKWCRWNGKQWTLIGLLLYGLSELGEKGCPDLSVRKLWIIMEVCNATCWKSVE